MKGTTSRRAVLLHPTLGLGGAERLILQLSAALRHDGWQTRFLVNAFDPGNCFEGAREEKVEVISSRWPGSLGGRFKAWCAYLRMRSMLGELARGPEPDLLVIDLLPHLIPKIRSRFPRLPILAYCHYPDRLLAPLRGQTWYDLYRRPFDALEREGLAQADRVLVNSEFTRHALLRCCPEVSQDRVTVLHPGVVDPGSPSSERDLGTRPAVLSLGRIHPSKNHVLALDSFAAAFASRPAEDRPRLVLAGGLDPADRSCVDEKQRLRERANQLGISQSLDWKLNCSDDALESVWKDTRILLYPPVAEHFGIVPLEAMVRGIPVVAVNEGGPCEVVAEGATGRLVCPTGPAMGQALRELWDDPARCQAFASAGRERALTQFGIARFEAAIQHEAGLLTANR